ncbi:MAG: DedA family protein [Patescibacteria group bacterium]
MPSFNSLIFFFIHLDTSLGSLIAKFGNFSYAVLFVIIFCETGLVVTPFLPGDSLLFAAGTFAATGAFDIFFLCLTLAFAAIAGDTANYWVGRNLGLSFFQNNRFIKLKPEYLAKTKNFFEKYGGKTIFLARFVPIVRTFAPFVAGVGKMDYSKFLLFNIAGGLTWVLLFVLLGYFFGNMPIVKENFSVAILFIILVSILPGIFEYVRSKKRS